MPTPGKNFPGQKGFPTPNSTPDETIRRVFIVPNSEEWLGLLEGAAQVLLDEWRYYDWGALTPAEAAAAFNTIVVDSYTNGCPATLPGGGRIMRLNPSTGHLEELGDDETWVEPSGDYSVPPITPREGEPDDIRCLAAANAANVLELLYESITDSIAGELEAAEAYAALVTAFIAAVGWEFAPIAFAIAAFFLAVFAVVYEIIKIIGADLWDGTFTDTLKCALYGCASDEGEGVVTFEWQCVQNALAAGTDALNFDQLRLFNQLNFIIQVIGGADGLNQAGATTAITEADCSECAGSPPELQIQVVDGTPYGQDLIMIDVGVWQCTSHDFSDENHWVLLETVDPARKFEVIDITLISGGGGFPWERDFPSRDTGDYVQTDPTGVPNVNGVGQSRPDTGGFTIQFTIIDS